MEQVLPCIPDLRIHLRCRRGVEGIVREEVTEFIAKRGKFRFVDVPTGVVAITPTAPFARTNIYAMRYRLDFIGKGHQRGAVRDVVNRAYARCPEILNDARRAPWAMDIHATPRGLLVEPQRARAYPRLPVEPRCRRAL
jgi:hypothetical protein